MKVAFEKVPKARIEMLPLIDIVFLLLVFFIYAMLSMAVHRALPVTLPESTTAGIDKAAFLSITVKSDGAVYLDEESVPLELLAEKLKRSAPAEDDPAVLLFADRNLSYQYLFKVLDQIRTAGLTRISLQAEADE
ncbi:MAG: biopolymer transporter ExbD [Deltaproteobacteria bacterium]|nr:biopolymer transporter ExbD [Deltaproteobacteria bacterium]